MWSLSHRGPIVLDIFREDVDGLAMIDFVTRRNRAPACRGVFRVAEPQEYFDLAGAVLDSFVFRISGEEIDSPAALLTHLAGFLGIDYPLGG